MAKSRDAFRTISEVSDWLDTPAHVLRFWESKFTQIKPVKRAGGRRYYRPQDMALLGGIKTLLHEEGMTIKGAQKLLREKGVKHVSALGPDIGDTAEGLPEDMARDVTPADTPAITNAPSTPELELIPDAELVEEAAPELVVEDVDDPWPSDPWSSDAEPIAARALEPEIEAEVALETKAVEPAAIQTPSRSIPALPDAAGAQARPGMLAIITTAQTAAVRKNMAAILPLASQLSAVHRRMASAR